MSHAFRQELAEAEQQAALDFHQRLLQKQIPSIRPEDPDSQNRRVPCLDFSAIDSYQVLSEPQDDEMPCSIEGTLQNVRVYSEDVIPSAPPATSDSGTPAADGSFSL